MDSELQRLTNQASDLVAGSSIVLDRQLRVAAFQVVDGLLDAEGRETILRRRALRSDGPDGDGRQQRDLSVHRAMVRLRCGGRSLGCLVLFTARPLDLTAPQPHLWQIQRRLSDALQRDESIRGAAARSRQELAACLLSEDPRRRSYARRELALLGLGDEETSYVALAVEVEPSRSQRALTEVVCRMHDFAPNALEVTLESQVTFFVGGPDGPAATRLAQRAAVRLHESCQARGQHGGDLRIGLGTPRTGLDAVHESHREATLARTRARSGEYYVSWSDLGVDQLLLSVPPDTLPGLSFAECLRRLTTAENPEILLRTLEVFLTHAGNVQRTAAALYVHRTTLYHRLRRIEDVLGMDLDAGEDRLALHLALKLQRNAPPAVRHLEETA